MEKKPYLEACKIVTTHGVRGGLKAESWCDSAEILAGLPKLYLPVGGEMLPLKPIRTAIYKGNWVLLWLEGCDTVEKAILYKDKILYARREDIPHGEGDYFIQDLRGLPIIDADSGRSYGTLHDVLPGAASDLYEIDTGKRDEKARTVYAYMPAVKAFVDRIDPDTGIYVRPIKGIFDAV